MAGLKRFVTYIYSYEEKKKGDNAGFARIEIRGDDCRIEIHLRAAYIGKSTCNAYLFREDAGDLIGYPIGEMTMRNGVGDLKTAMKAAQIAGAPLDIYQADGLIIIGGDERIFLSRWKEDVAPEVSKERFRIWNPEQTTRSDIPNTPVPTEKTTEQAPASVNNSEDADTPPAMPASPEKNGNRLRTSLPEPKITGSAQTTENTAAGPQNATAGSKNTQNENFRDAQALSEETAHPHESAQETETVSATEIPMRNVFPEYDWASVWERLTDTHPVFAPFEDKNAVCIQIELKDLRELPKRYWYLGNNSFLLHGFFNYRYLVVGKTGEERWFIGVPGIYQRQERVMAAIFGFPEFITAAVSSGRPGWEEEMQAAELRREVGGDPVNQFGCWYRFIEE